VIGGNAIDMHSNIVMMAGAPEEGEASAIEGKLGQGKNCYQLNYIRVKTQKTSKT